MGHRSTQTEQRVHAMSSTTKIAVASSTSSSTDVLGSAPFDDARRHHVDAVPRADVLARPAQDAVVGIEHQVLRRLHALGEPRRIDGLHDVVLVDVDLGLGERHRVYRYPPVGRVSRWTAELARQFCMIAPPTSTMMIGTVSGPSRRVAELLEPEAVDREARSASGGARVVPLQLLVGEVEPERRDDRRRDQQEEDQSEREDDRRGPGPLERPSGTPRRVPSGWVWTWIGVAVSTWLIRSVVSVGGAIIDTCVWCSTTDASLVNPFTSSCFTMPPDPVVLQPRPDPRLDAPGP